MAYPDIDTSVVQWQVRTHFDVLNELLDDVASGRAAVIAIDGHSGSGKTTLANGLAALEPHAAVIHTDDLASKHPLDWGELLVEHLLIPVREGRLPISYRPEAWVRHDRPGAIAIPRDISAVFVEGLGAARREARPWLDAVVWVHAHEDVMRRRVTSRSHETVESRHDLVQQENAFLAEERPWEVADVVVAGQLGQPAHDGRYGNVVTAQNVPQVSQNR